MTLHEQKSFLLNAKSHYSLAEAISVRLKIVFSSLMLMSLLIIVLLIEEKE